MSEATPLTEAEVLRWHQNALANLDVPRLREVEEGTLRLIATIRAREAVTEKMRTALAYLSAMPCSPGCHDDCVSCFSAKALERAESGITTDAGKLSHVPADDAADDGEDETPYCECGDRLCPICGD